MKEEIERIGKGYIEIKISCDKLDMMIPEYMARILKEAPEIGFGLLRYIYKSSGYRLEVKEAYN
ncbi:MAG: hypothetical protein ACP5GI_08455 [Sulfolobales archaeon]